MSHSLEDIEKTLKTIFKQIKKDQSSTLSIQIAASFIAGRTAAKEMKSIKSADTQTEDDGLTDEEKAAIALLLATYLGYLSKFNDVAQTQVLEHVREMVKIGASNQEIKGYIDDIFTGKELITIDNVGKTKKEIYVDKNLKLSEITKKIEKVYSSSLVGYASMLGSTVSHGAYEGGRKVYYRGQGHELWTFVGPADERARPWHVALLGEVFIYDTTRSEYAERCLQEPRCRHRGNVYYGDSRDVPAEKWQELKDKNGLYWDEENKKWSMEIQTPIKQQPKTKPEITKEELENIIKKKELKIKDRKTEKAYVFDKNGKVLLEKAGGKHEVEFTDDELKLFKNNVVTHNHPANASFSSVDIQNVCQNGAKEIRAVTANRTFTMKLKDGTNFTDELWTDKISKEYEKHFNDLITDYRTRVQKGQLSIEDATYQVSHLTWFRVSKNIDEIEYKVIKGA